MDHSRSQSRSYIPERKLFRRGQIQSAVAEKEVWPAKICDLLAFSTRQVPHGEVSGFGHDTSRKM